jgi:hypothetical protein
VYTLGGADYFRLARDSGLIGQCYAKLGGRATLEFHRHRGFCENSSNIDLHCEDNGSGQPVILIQ